VIFFPADSWPGFYTYTRFTHLGRFKTTGGESRMLKGKTKKVRQRVRLEWWARFAHFKFGKAGL
jgi:hypothetical protein